MTDWSRPLCACWLLAILLNRSLMNDKSTPDLGFESRVQTPRQLQDWILKCLHGGRGQALALWGSDQLSVRSVSRKASTRTRTGKCSQSATCERVDVPRLPTRWGRWMEPCEKADLARATPSVCGTAYRNASFRVAC